MVVISVTGGAITTGGEGMGISTGKRLRIRSSFGGVVISLTGDRKRVVS